MPWLHGHLHSWALTCVHIHTQIDAHTHSKNSNKLKTRKLYRDGSVEWLSGCKCLLYDPNDLGSMPDSPLWK